MCVCVRELLYVFLRTHMPVHTYSTDAHPISPPTTPHPHPSPHPTQQSSPASPLVPIDLTVPPNTSVVAVTGPNTGGKTASLKALGLLALMAKAGMYIPVVGGRGGESSGGGGENDNVEHGGGEHGGNGAQRGTKHGGMSNDVCVAWFDKVCVGVLGCIYVMSVCAVNMPNQLVLTHNNKNQQKYNKD